MSRVDPQAGVLVVDDEPMTVELLAVSLRFQGFEVQAATSGTDTTEPKLIHTLRSVGYVLREPQPSRT